MWKSENKRRTGFVPVRKRFQIRCWQGKIARRSLSNLANIQRSTTENVVINVKTYAHDLHREGGRKLAINLKAEMDANLIEAYGGKVFLPFKSGENKRSAVKIIDDRGIESLKVMEVD